MKKILFAALIGSVLAGSALFTGCNGCKEIGPNVNLSKPTTDSILADSTWMLSAAAIGTLTTDPHNVLVEEFTGQACSNCPAAHQHLDDIAALYPAGRVNIIGLYINGLPQTNPPSGYIYDFRDPSATLIGKNIYGNGIALPEGGVDRVPVGGQILLYSNDWAAAVSSRITTPDSLNLAVSSTYNTTTLKATITVTVTYTQNVSTKQNLSVVVVEDSMVDLQEFPDSVHSGYHFNDIFRDMVSMSIPSGDPVLDTLPSKAKGLVFRHSYSYTPKTVTPAIKPANCRVIAFINTNVGSDMHVLQSAQTKLMGP